MIDKNLMNVKIHFSSAGASYMKALLASEISSQTGETQAIAQGLYNELRSNVVTLFSQSTWDAL